MIAPPQSLHTTARRYLEAGLCVVPKRHGEKRPVDEWKAYQSELPTADQLDEWFAGGFASGLGIICGAVSGGLEVLDLDVKNDPDGNLNARMEVAVKAYAPGAWEKLVIESTPSGGRHIFFRSAHPAGNLKLALPPTGTKAIVETRGEGGFVVCAPTLGYEVLQGSLANIPTLTEDERDSLLAAARSLDRSAAKPSAVPQNNRGGHDGLSPLDDYNARGAGDALDRLAARGWHTGPDHGGARMLRRPGKDSGWSATWNHAGRGTLCVFSSSTEFDTAPTTYSPAAIFAKLECNDDFQAAAKKLAGMGYGEPATTKARERVEDEGAAPTSLAPFTVWKPSQFLAYTAPVESILLEYGLVEHGKWTSIVGIGGLGKTRLALELSLRQITGKPWCGLKTCGKAARWLILSTENGLRRWKSDLTAMLAGLSDSERESVDAGLLIMALTDDEDGDLNSGSPEAMVRLAATLRQHAPEVIVFDPFADMIDGDENKTQDIVQTLRVLRKIVRKDAPRAAVIVIHHARTGAGNVAQAGDNYAAGNFGRGAKALYSAVRAEIQLAPGDRDDANRIVLACGKNSDGPKFTPRCIVFDPESCTYSVDPSFDVDAWRADVNGQRSQSTVTIADVVETVRELAPKPGDETSTKDVHKILEPSGAHIRSVQRQLSAALEAGYVRKGNKRGAWRLGAKPLPV